MPKSCLRLAIKLRNSGTLRWVCYPSTLPTGWFKIGSRMVGYFKDGVFKETSQNHLNTYARDETGSYQESSPFGMRSDHTKEASKVFDYALKGYDADIGAVRMGQRFYDPDAKRFLTPDQEFLLQPEKIVESPIQGNLYSYVSKDPINKLDPDGDAEVMIWNSLTKDVQGELSVGHVAIRTQDGTYVSHFPDKSQPINGSKTNFKGKFHLFKQDVKIYGRNPDKVFDVKLTDEQAANKEAQKVLSEKPDWKLLDCNCADTTERVLRAGGEAVKGGEFPLNTPGKLGDELKSLGNQDINAGPHRDLPALESL